MARECRMSLARDSTSALLTGLCCSSALACSSRMREAKPSMSWGLRSNGTESTVKAETLQQQAFQKALFSLNETYQLASRLFGTAMRNGIEGV